MKMKQTNIIGDTYKERSIDYGLIDRINKQYETEARKDELKRKLAKKKKVENEKEVKEKEKEENKPVVHKPVADVKYIKTPDELRDIKGHYILEKDVYVIDFEIYVPNGCGLILEKGVIFEFTKDAGITCEGRFEAKGRKGLEVLLTAKDKEDVWENLYLQGGAEAILNYARFSYGNGRTNSYSNVSGGAILLEAKNEIRPNLTIINSCFEHNSTMNCGGAIYCNNGNIIIKENNRFENNSAKSHGGAILIDEGNAVIGENNRFENNYAKDKGGAIYNYKGTLDIDKLKNIFSGNNPDDIYER